MEEQAYEADNLLAADNGVRAEHDDAGSG